MRKPGTGAGSGRDQSEPATSARHEGLAERWFERALQLSLKLVLIPVVTLVIAAFAAFLYGAALLVWALIQVVPHPFPIGHKIGLFLLDIDLFLVGATLLIGGIGLYELFISKVDAGSRGAALPGWLVIRDLNDLKVRVASMLVLVASVSFVDVVVGFSGGHDILYLGGAVALFIAALTAFLRFGTGRGAADRAQRDARAIPPDSVPRPDRPER